MIILISGQIHREIAISKKEMVSLFFQTFFNHA